MLKKPVTSWRSPSTKRLSTIALLSWSASTTAAASANQRQALDKFARFAGSIEVQAAAAADAVVVDIGAVVPAAVALGMRTRRDRHAFRAALHSRRRGDHQEPELVVQACEALV